MTAGRRNYPKWLAAALSMALAGGMPASAEDTADSAAKPAPKPQVLIAKPEFDPLLPRPRPDPQGKPAIGPEPGVAGQAEGAPPAGDEDGEACQWRLRALGAAFEPAPPAAENAPCKAAALLVLSELSPGVGVSPEAVLTCEAAEAVATWMRDIVGPAAASHLDATPAGIEISSSFDCRAGSFGAIAHAHRSAEALDITGISFVGHPSFTIGDRDAGTGPEAAFQRAIRTGACRHFTSVHGPGSSFGGSELDGTHLHVDVRGSQRICR